MKELAQKTHFLAICANNVAEAARKTQNNLDDRVLREITRIQDHIATLDQFIYENAERKGDK